MVIDNFFNEYRFLSNFYPCIINFEGINFPCVENAYQAAKTQDVDLRSKFIFITAGDAKRLGRKIPIGKHWTPFYKLTIMSYFLHQKFSTDPLEQMLKNTYNAKLIEGNTWGDTFWGVCNGEGNNHLGKILIQIRSDKQNIK